MPDNTITVPASLSETGSGASFWVTSTEDWMTYGNAQMLEYKTAKKQNREPADWMMERLEKGIAALKAENEGLRALRQWEEERLQERERESWTTC